MGAVPCALPVSVSVMYAPDGWDITVNDDCDAQPERKAIKTKEIKFRINSSKFIQHPNPLESIWETLFTKWFKSTRDFTPAHESLSQVWFWRVYRSRGLTWSRSVVLHDRWWWCPFKGHSKDLVGLLWRLYRMAWFSRGICDEPELGFMFST